MLFYDCINSFIAIYSALNSRSFLGSFPSEMRSALLPSPTNKNQNGFSLFEVLVVLFILTLLSGITWNSSAGFFSDSQYEQANAAQSDLASGLLLARQYAVQAQQSIELCGGVAAGLSGIDEEECSGDWSSGWFIIEADELKRQHLFETNIAVSWSGFPQDKSYIRFYANGHTDYQNGTFILCVDGWSSRITLNQSGRFYLGETVFSEESTSC